MILSSLPSDHLKTSDGVIRVGVYHRNLLSMDELLGQTDIPLYKIHINDRPQIRWAAVTFCHT